MSLPKRFISCHNLRCNANKSTSHLTAILVHFLLIGQLCQFNAFLHNYAGLQGTSHCQGAGQHRNFNCHRNRRPLLLSRSAISPTFKPQEISKLPRSQSLRPSALLISRSKASRAMQQTPRQHALRDLVRVRIPNFGNVTVPHFHPIGPSQHDLNRWFYDDLIATSYDFPCMQIAQEARKGEGPRMGRARPAVLSGRAREPTSKTRARY